MAEYIRDSAQFLKRLVDRHKETIDTIKSDYGFPLDGRETYEDLIMARCAHDAAIEKFLREYRDEIMEPLNKRILDFTTGFKYSDDEVPF